MPLRCRQICEADLPGVTDLLARGFPDRPKDYWAAGLARLTARKPIGDYPRFGYLLEKDGVIGGVLLTIYSQCEADGELYVRCNLSSWHVAHDFLSYGAFLVSSAIRRPEVVYINVSPAPHTRPIIEAQGFTPLWTGLTIAALILNASVPGARVAAFQPADKNVKGLSEAERALLSEHVNLGCVALICQHDDRSYPFVFLKSARWRGRIQGLHLAYCRAIEDVVTFAGPIGRALGRRGWFLGLDSNGPVPGLHGRFMSREGKYYKGPVRPRLGDLSYTEDVFFH